VQWLDVNLATSPARNTTLVWSSYSVAALVLAAATWANVSTYSDQHERGEALATQAGSFAKQQRDLETRAGRAKAAIEKHDVPGLQLQASKANQIIDWKAFSWTRLFNQMEKIQPSGVRMNSVRPVFYGAGEGDPRSSSAGAGGVPISIEGTARTLDDIGELQQRLLDDPHFASVLPERLARSDSGEIVFQLRFQYRPELPKAEPTPAPSGAPKAAAAPAEPVEVQDEWGEVAPAKTGRSK
jgi:hypothetical protein